MKELEDHLKLVCQILEEESFHFHSFLREIKERSEWLNQFPCTFLPKKKEPPRKVERSL